MSNPGWDAFEHRVKEKIALEIQYRTRYHGENRPLRCDAIAAMAYNLNMWRDRASQFAAGWQASPDLELAAYPILASWWGLIALPFEPTDRGVLRGTKAKAWLTALVRLTREKRTEQ